MNENYFEIYKNCDNIKMGGGFKIWGNELNTPLMYENYCFQP